MAENGKLAEALAKAQSEYKPVPKSRTARVKMKSGGEYEYNYADLSDVLKMALPVLSANGLAFSQPMRRKELKLYLTSRLMHVSGELLESDGISIPETLPPQEFGSTLAYWRRYDGCALLGLATEDDDAALSKQKKSKLDQKLEAQEAATQCISPYQARAFNAACQQSRKSVDQIKMYLNNIKVGSVEELQKNQFDMAIKWASRPVVSQPAILQARQGLPAGEYMSTCHKHGDFSHPTPDANCPGCEER